MPGATRAVASATRSAAAPGEVTSRRAARPSGTGVHRSVSLEDCNCGAISLAEKGVKPLVLERSGRLGGRAHSVTDRASGDVIDIGPHLVHSEYRNFPAFLARLGSDGAITWQPEKVITLVTGGRAVEIAHKALPAPFSLMPDFGRTPGLDARDFLSGRAALWRALRFDENDVDALDAVSAYEYLRGKGVSPRMIDVFWRFESMALMNVPLERCSAAALLRVHSWLMRYRDLHFGFPAKGLGELFTAPARRRIEAMGGRVLVDAEVTRIETRDNAHECHVVDGRHFAAPFCVAAVPPQDLARLHSQ